MGLRFRDPGRRTPARILPMAAAVALCILVVACGKSGTYRAITGTGSTISVPGTVLPAEIPESFHLDKAQALERELPCYLMWIKVNPLRGGGNVLVFDDSANIVTLSCRVEESGYVGELLRPISVPAQPVAVIVGEPDAYYVAFVPLDPGGATWEKGLRAVAYQDMDSREVRIAYLDEAKLVELGQGVGYSDVLGALQEAIDRRAAK
jgi:hypothetical protein